MAALLRFWLWIMESMKKISGVQRPMLRVSTVMAFVALVNKERRVSRQLYDI
jgi:hypothetical protein